MWTLFRYNLKKNTVEKRRYMVECRDPGRMHPLKKECILKWCKLKLQKIPFQRHKVEDYQIVDEDESTVEPLENIVKAEDGEEPLAAW